METILVVDDAEEIRMVLEGILEDKGYNVITANDAESAWTMLNEAEPPIKVVLLDRILPNMSGTDLLFKIRKDQRLKDTQVILQSSLNENTDIADGTEAGANKYIVKPFEASIVLAMVKSCLRDYDQIDTLKKISELSDDMKTRMLTIFSHGFRTPLNAIIGFSSFLLDSKEPISEITRTSLEAILSSGEELLGFVQNSLLLVQLKSNSFDIAQYAEPTSISEILVETIQEAGNKASERKVEIHLNISEEIVVNVDGSYLIQSFGFVLDNAIKFSPEGSSVDITVSRENHSTARIIFTDQGPGIEPETRDSIFEEFSIRDINHLQKGFGISMAIVKLVCDRIGGDITLESELEKGTSVKISLPIAS